MTCSGIPGIVALSIAGVPSSFSSTQLFSLTRIVERLRDHHLRDRLRGAVLGQLRTGQAPVQLGSNTLESFQPIARGARPSLDRMRAVAADNVRCQRDDARNKSLERFQFVAAITTLVTFFIP